MCVKYLCCDTIQMKQTGLMKASQNGHADTVKVLLVAEADPNITDKVKLLWVYLYSSDLVCDAAVWVDCSFFCCHEESS